MGTTTRISFEEFLNLPEREGMIYELDDGELLMEPSPALRHNLIRQQIAVALIRFVKSKRLGVVAEEMDFRASTRYSPQSRCCIYHKGTPAKNRY